jgi:hypothetical protein
MTTNSTAAEGRLARLGIHLLGAATPFGARLPFRRATSFS